MRVFLQLICVILLNFSKLESGTKLVVKLPRMITRRTAKANSPQGKPKGLRSPGGTRVTMAVTRHRQISPSDKLMSSPDTSDKANSPQGKPKGLRSPGGTRVTMAVTRHRQISPSDKLMSSPDTSDKANSPQGKPKGLRSPGGTRVTMAVTRGREKTPSKQVNSTMVHLD